MGCVELRDASARLTWMCAGGDSERMASKKELTAPPRGPAVVRPAMGALLLTLSGPACGDDDGTSTDSGTTEQPPMPNPTDTAPMAVPTTNDDSTQPPMPDPTDTATGTSTGPGGSGSSTGADESTSSGGSDGSTTAIPPMPPPTTGE